MMIVESTRDSRAGQSRRVMGISIAMCTYNGASYLPQQLDSIRSQTRLPDELILCDDGSTDATLSIIKEFAKSAPFVTRVHRNAKNLGYSRNFASAVALCSQDIIALCDQDDLWYTNKLAHIESRFQLDATMEGLFSNGDLIDSNSRPIERTLWESFLFTEDEVARFNSGGAVDVLLRHNVVTGMAFAFRSRLKGLMASVPDSWIHDGWVAFLIAARFRLIADPERLVAYRVHSAQQVGAPISFAEKRQWIRTQGVSSFLDRTRERNLDEYQRTAPQFEDLAKFLRLDARPGDAALIRKVEAKAAHARRGALALSSARLRRWPMLANQLESYRRFSPTGLRALPRDLLI